MENVLMDPETEFLASKQETGNEWELFKENVRPLKRGRNISLLNGALKSHSDFQLKKSLLDKQRRLIEAVDEYKGEDPLQPWLECIKWVQESFPPGGESSGLVVIYEQCVRTFWHEDCYKDDLRCLKVWLEYAEIKIVWMVKSSLVFWRQIKLDRHTLPSMLHMPCTWNLKIKLQLQMKYLIYKCTANWKS